MVDKCSIVLPFASGKFTLAPFSSKHSTDVKFPCNEEEKKKITTWTKTTLRTKINNVFECENFPKKNWNGRHKDIINHSTIDMWLTRYTCTWIPQNIEHSQFTDSSWNWTDIYWALYLYNVMFVANYTGPSEKQYSLIKNCHLAQRRVNAERMNERMNERINGWKNEWMEEWKKEWKDGKCMDGWKHEWMKERMNIWMNGWKNEM